MPNLSMMRRLFDCTDKESIMHEVGKLSEDEAKAALIAVLLSWRFGNKVDDEIKQKLNDRIAELEKQLAAQVHG